MKSHSTLGIPGNVLGYNRTWYGLKISAGIYCFLWFPFGADLVELRKEENVGEDSIAILGTLTILRVYLRTWNEFSSRIPLCRAALYGVQDLPWSLA